MKHFFTLFVALILFAQSFAQVPQGVSYQAIAFNAGGTPVVSGNVGVKVSITDNSATGTVVYAETFTKTTNAQGLFNLNIGEGTPVTGTFSGINWAVNSKFLKVEIDPAGGISYTTAGTNQLMSVPYALFADKANQATSLTNGGTLTANNGNFLIVGSNEAKAFNTTSSSWTSASTTGVIDQAITSGNNFLIVAVNEAKAWDGATGNWFSTSTSGVIDSVAAANGNFLITANNEAKTWNKQTGSWVATSLSGVIGRSITSNGNALVVSINEAKAWSASTSTWVSTSTTGVIDTIVGSNGNFLIVSINEAKAWNGQTGVWTSASISVVISNAIGTE